MGLARGSVKFLLEAGRQRPLTGAVLTLGRQDVWLTWDELEQIAAGMDVTLRDPGSVELNDKPEFAARRQISDRTLLRALGFDQVDALDASDFEGADHLVDLNSPNVPAHLRERYDTVIDGGTIEHVFNVPNALANIHSMLVLGGRAVHFSPSSNHLDHGFWMFSPTLFRDYYLANRYSIDTLRVIRHTRRPHTDPWLIYDYGTIGRPFDHLSFGGLDDAMYAICCIATKGSESTSNVVPQQAAYVEAWTGGATAGNVTRRSSLVARLDGWSPRLGRAARRLRPVRDVLVKLGRLRIVSRPRLGIKPVARY